MKYGLKLNVLVLILMAGVLFTSCTEPRVVDPTKSCSEDGDCVPAGCCHAADAVNQQNAPQCEGRLCTMECVPETLDCGQGTIQCIKKECIVKWK